MISFLETISKNWNKKPDHLSSMKTPADPRSIIA